MTSRLLSVFVAVSVWSCGGPDSTALVGGSGSMEAETEFETSSDALLSNAASVWFPMQEGNTWTLESSSGARKVLTYSDVADGMAWLDGLTSSGEWTGVSPDAPNTLYKWDDVSYQWSPYFRFGYAVTPWTVGSGACSTFTARRTGTDVSIVTPAGTFGGARTIGFTMVTQPNVRCAMPAFNEVSFAPTVGPVMIKTAAGEKFVLKSAWVNGVTYPRAAQPKSTLKSDKYSYVNQENTIRCITTPCPSNEVTAVAKLTYTVTNTTGASITWQFSSGKQFDVDVINSAGKVVKHWSDGRYFTMALTSFTLAPGQSKTFNIEVELKDAQGLQLSGAYSLKAYLTPRNSTPPAAAQTPISVTLQ
jgi:hypothetical protein